MALGTTSLPLTTNKGIRNKTIESLASSKVQAEQEKLNCEARGGKWDEINLVCILPDSPISEKKVEEEPNVPAPKGTITTDGDTGKPTGFINSKGQFVKANIKDIEAATGRPIEESTTASQFSQQQDLQRLGSQVGQFDELGISPTGLDINEAATVGLIDAIPTALKTAAAVGGAAFISGGAATAGVGAIPAGAVGAVAGFVGGLASSMKSNFRSQRTDTTTAQQRVLDEGKQNLNDWATLAKSDPANRNKYLAEYNKQAALIDQAYRQMKLDTSRDITKFETALPNLAEFEAFYSAGGERDALDNEMRNALLVQSPENYDMIELAYRRKE